MGARSRSAVSGSSGGLLEVACNGQWEFSVWRTGKRTAARMSSFEQSGRGCENLGVAGMQAMRQQQESRVGKAGPYRAS